MSKQHKIRWKQTDLQELNRVVRNYNAKVNRLLKKDPQKYKHTLPQYVHVVGKDNFGEDIIEYSPKLKPEQIKNLVHTRQDLKRELNSLKRFSKRGSEELIQLDNNDNNLQLTKWQHNEMKRSVANINRRRKKRLDELKELEVTQHGRPVGYTKEQIGMGSIKENDLSPMNAWTKTTDRTKLTWKWHVIRTNRQSDYFTRQDYQLRENFIKGIEETYNPYDVRELVEHIKNMDIKDFLLKFESENEDFTSIYAPNAEDYEHYLTGLYSTWKPKTN